MKTTIEEKSRVACTFQAEKFTADGTITYRGPVFENTILDVGLDSLASRPLGFYTSCATHVINVGTDNTAPTTSQTGLLSYLASTDTRYSGSNGYQTASPCHKWISQVFEFAVGDCTGNLTEVGLSHDSNDTYFNRQLFRDGAGDPTTITVLDSEGLRITATLYWYPDIEIGETSSGSFLLNETDTINFTRDIPDGSNDWLTSSNDNIMVGFHFPDHNYAELSDSETGFDGTDADSYSMVDYSTGDYYREGTFTWNASTFTGDIASIMFNILAGSRYFTSASKDFSAFRLDPVITVTDVEEFTVTLRRSWGRYAA